MFDTSHLHPMIVHFPIAIVMVGFLFEICALLFKKQEWLPKASYWLLLLGTLAAIVAYISGELFTSDFSGTAAIVKHTHETLAAITLVTLIINSILKIYIMRKHLENTGLRWVSLALYLLSAICVGITGFYGGNLVYNYMMPL
jgi:uncharacterized membrane protein